MKAVFAVLLCATALAGCYPAVDIGEGRDQGERPAVRNVARLACPEQQGDLRRVGIASADGAACAYTAPNEGEVTLRLVPIGLEGVTAAMAPIEAELRRTVPAPPATPIARPSSTDSDVNISMPFFEVQAGDDSARVRMPGVEVDADGEDATVNIGGRSGETVRVNARNGVSEVRVSHGRQGDVRATYILSTDVPTAAGWRTAGYQARGPSGGPLVVATARSRAESDQLFEELDELIDRSFEVAAQAR